MIKAIIDNPYRVLGIYADAGESEIMNAADRLLSLPNTICETDFSINGLPKPQRDTLTVSMARETLLGKGDSDIHKLFWFVKPEDGAGLREIMVGKVADARKIWLYATGKEARHNVMVSFLVDGVYHQAAHWAYKNIFNSDYRESLLKTTRPFKDVLAGYKRCLFDASNIGLVPPDESSTWEQYLQISILSNIWEIIQTDYLQPAKQQIKKGDPSSYYNALSSLILPYRNRYVSTLQSFADTKSLSYILKMRELVNTGQGWIEEYLLLSKDLFKYRNMEPFAVTFSIRAQDEIQRSYLEFLSTIMQVCGGFEISPDICDICYSTARKLYHYYSFGNVSSALYRSLLEGSSTSFLMVKYALGKPDSCYEELANFAAKIGFSIVEKELANNVSEQVAADCGEVLSYIDRVIDRQLLYDHNLKRRDSCLNRLESVRHVSGRSTSRSNNPQQKHGIEKKQQINQTATNQTKKVKEALSQGVYSSSIKKASVYKFILIALIIEVLLGLSVGNSTMLGVGVALAFGYILVVFLAERGFDKDAKALVYIYVSLQTVVSIVGLILI